MSVGVVGKQVRIKCCGNMQRLNTASVLNIVCREERKSLH